MLLATPTNKQSQQRDYSKTFDRRKYLNSKALESISGDVNDQESQMDKQSFARSRSTRASHMTRNSKLPSIANTAHKQHERDYAQFLTSDILSHASRLSKVSKIPPSRTLHHSPDRSVGSRSVMGNRDDPIEKVRPRSKANSRLFLYQ